MNSYELLFLKLIRKIYQKLIGQKNNFQVTDTLAQLSARETSQKIKLLLESNEPCFIARFGEVELDAVLTYYFMKFPRIIQYKNFIQGISHRGSWSEEILFPLANNAGVFPKNQHIAEKFAKLYLSDSQLIDILGSWQSGENILQNELRKASFVRLQDLEPYYHEDPWTQALKSKKVLVVHPFEESIQNQFQYREFLFEDARILPKFELQTIKAVQSAAGSNPDFQDWFEALDFMKHKISKSDFDIALIGCGAYGMPLGAHVKRIGKKAVHLGGAVQILFGIKGKRWDDHPVISKLYNSYWTRPLLSETPQAHQKIEDGCYW